MAYQKPKYTFLVTRNKGLYTLGKKGVTNIVVSDGRTARIEFEGGETHFVPWHNVGAYTCAPREQKEG